jgi:hypothetical protein
MERFQFAYFYKKPDLIGNQLNHLALSVMIYAPIFMMFFGYWHFGNRQQFFNTPTFLTHSGDVYDPKHDIFHTDKDDGLEHYHLFLIGLILLLFFFPWAKMVQKLGQCFRCFYRLQTVDDDWNVV